MLIFHSHFEVHVSKHHLYLFYAEEFDDHALFNAL